MLAACGGLDDAPDTPAAPSARSKHSQLFWDALGLVGDGVEGYATLREMAAAADLVVRGTLAAPRATRQIRQQLPVGGPQQVAFYVAMDIVPTEVVRGMPGPLVIEFFRFRPPDQLDAFVVQLEETLPTGEMLMFLRWKTDASGAYRLVNGAGLWTSVGAGGVTCPLARPADTAKLRSEAAGFENVMALAEYVR